MKTSPTNILGNTQSSSAQRIDPSRLDKAMDANTRAWAAIRMIADDELAIIDRCKEEAHLALVLAAEDISAAGDFLADLVGSEIKPWEQIKASTACSDQIEQATPNVASYDSVGELVSAVDLRLSSSTCDDITMFTYCAKGIINSVLVAVSAAPEQQENRTSAIHAATLFIEKASAYCEKVGANELARLYEIAALAAGNYEPIIANQDAALETENLEIALLERTLKLIEQADTATNIYHDKHWSKATAA